MPDDKESPVNNERVLSFDEIMAADDMAPVVVPIPAWGGKVQIRPLAGGENVAAYEAATQGGKLDTRIYNKALIAASLDLTAEQADALYARKSDRAILALIGEINRLNAFTPEAAEAADAAFRPAGE